MRVLLILFALVACVGCRIERHWLVDEPRNQVVRVDSGDRLYMEIDELPDSGYRWIGSCSDSDVDVKIRHVEKCAEIEIRIHRGYDGPSVVVFRNVRPSTGEVSKEFRVSLFKRTGDVAFWE